MRLMVASYNDGIVDWNAEAEETNLISYSIVHEFNRPATAIIVLRDNDGTVMQKYNVDANDVYLGPSKATIEDPNDTDVFYGRIVKARHDTASHRVYLMAYDWLSQLNEQRIDYSMCEDLDGSDLRESTLHADFASFSGPVYKVAGSFYATDGDMVWANDLFNGVNGAYYLVFPNSMAGAITVNTGPYTETVSHALVSDAWSSVAYADAWADDAEHHTMVEDVHDWTVIYKFRIYMPDSARMVSITGARIRCVYDLNSDTTTYPVKVEFYDHSAAAYISLGNITGTDGAPCKRSLSWTIPGQYLTAAILTDASGEAWVRFSVTCDPAATSLQIFYLLFEVDGVTTGYSTPLLINDTFASTSLQVPTDLTLTGVGLWEGCPYSIVKKIFRHLDSGETPAGTLITDGDTMVALTCAATIEHTSGICTRQYQGRTRLEIMQDLTGLDKAVFWLTLGGTTVTWKSTFNDGAPTALTDASVLEWREGEYDYEPMRNEYKVYGVRIGENQLVSTDSDAASILKYKATRTEIVPNAYTVNQYDTDQLADKLVTRDAVVDLYLTALLPGLSTLRLGSEVSITSTYLNLAAAKYVVTRWAYDSKRYRTEIRLAPRTSNGYIEHVSFGEGYRQVVEKTQRTAIDSYLPESYTKVVTNP